MNNLRFTSCYPAVAIKEELAPSRREGNEEFKKLSYTFQQGLRLCSPRFQASMDDYSINYHGSLAIQHPARYGMSSGIVRKLEKSSLLDHAPGLISKWFSSLPPTLRELFGFEGDVELILASPTEDFNHGTLHEPLFNLSSPRTNFSTDDTDESWTAGLQLVSNRDCSMMIEMDGTPMEHFHSGGGMSPNTVSHLSVSTISDDFDRVTSGPFANGTMNEQAELLDNLAIVVSPHLDNSVTSLL